jgi:hypothetical protein
MIALLFCLQLDAPFYLVGGGYLLCQPQNARRPDCEGPSFDIPFARQCDSLGNTGKRSPSAWQKKPAQPMAYGNKVKLHTLFNDKSALDRNPNSTRQYFHISEDVRYFFLILGWHR